ncbi:MAG: nucleotidyltransferase domain-containing protein [Parcubacteria group bacterium]|jgi:hypothetical protein
MLGTAKEKIIRKRIALLERIPFVRLAVISGSCVTGNATDDSDIDVIIGAKDNRIYLCRALTLLTCDLLNVRNRPPRPERDKLCLSHFMSMSDLRMNNPENSYEADSYPFLFPVYGKSSDCAAFFRMNAHIIKEVPDYEQYSLYIGGKKHWLARLAEKTLSGKLGDMLEKWTQKKQIRRIQERAKALMGKGRKMRVITRPNRVETYYEIY